MDNLTKNKIKSLLLKGFNKEEIINLLNLSAEEDIAPIIKELENVGIVETSSNFYSELQKDLSKLVITELNKDSRDSNVVLNAIKLQAELQEKKLQLDRTAKLGTKINRDYIYTRDQEINKLVQNGLTVQEVAEKFKISILSVKQSLDRCSLELTDELKSLNPSVISETIGLEQNIRVKILKQAFTDNLTRKEVREMVNKLKNETR